MSITYDFAPLDTRLGALDKAHDAQQAGLNAVRLLPVDQAGATATTCRMERLRIECHLAHELALVIETLQRQSRTTHDLLGVASRRWRRLAWRYRLRQWWYRCRQRRADHD